MIAGVGGDGPTLGGLAFTCQICEGGVISFDLAAIPGRPFGSFELLMMKPGGDVLTFVVDVERHQGGVPIGRKMASPTGIEPVLPA